MTDLSNIKASEINVDIKHPGTGEPFGVTVKVMPLSDERMKKIRRDIQNRNSHLAARGKTFTAEEIENNSIKITTAAITGWEWGDNEYKGSVPSYTPLMVNTVLTELEWFRWQIDEVLDKLVTDTELAKLMMNAQRRAA